VIADRGPFADGLTSYAGNSEYEEHAVRIDGKPARIVSYRGADNRFVAAARVPELDSLTVTVRADESVPRAVVTEILNSIRRATG
jgi:hypothetical protein